jgi:hypothetical protein
LILFFFLLLSIMIDGKGFYLYFKIKRKDPLDCMDMHAEFYIYKFYMFIYFNLFSYSKGIQTPGRHVRTRLYFTSESHVHSLLTAIRYGGLLDVRNNLFIY